MNHSNLAHPSGAKRSQNHSFGELQAPNLPLATRSEHFRNRGTMQTTLVTVLRQGLDPTPPSRARGHAASWVAAPPAEEPRATAPPLAAAKEFRRDEPPAACRPECGWAGTRRSAAALPSRPNEGPRGGCSRRPVGGPHEPTTPGSGCDGHGVARLRPRRGTCSG
jgi:hypothetical protein